MASVMLVACQGDDVISPMVWSRWLSDLAESDISRISVDEEAVQHGLLSSFPLFYSIVAFGDDESSHSFFDQKKVCPVQKLSVLYDSRIPFF